MKRFPTTVYNWVSFAGIALAAFSVAAIVILYLWDVLAGAGNPYIGILLFMVLPVGLIAGLILIPIGMWRERRRIARGATQPLVVDLGNPRHRNALLTFTVGTCAFLLASTVGLYQGYHYMESEEFCGVVCHQVMEPEHTAYLNSPHARVACVSCHIGPGADWYVHSKLSGARQVIKVALGTWPTPIPTPIQHLRPAQDVCEQCHWPEKFFSDRQVTYDHFLGNRDNSHWVIRMAMHVGGTAESGRGHATGIHWHIDPRNRMTYVSSDSSRQAFDAVIWERDGDPVVYTKNGQPLADSVLARKRAQGLVRTMDCIDCHNRPSHAYESPLVAVNAALADGRLDRSLPWIKREAVAALSVPYETRAAARDSIAGHLERFYSGLGMTVPAAAVQTVHDLYARNMFPEMRVRWDEYPENSGHFLFPGCFRCHGSDLRTAAGEGIRRDCTQCHTIQAQGPADSLASTLIATGLPFRHPVDIRGAERTLACTECHTGDSGVYLAQP